MSDKRDPFHHETPEARERKTTAGGARKRVTWLGLGEE